MCSFANLNGGDVIYGIRDERDGNGRPTGVPESIEALGALNFSAECERLESIIRDGIKPRVPNVRTRGIEIAGQGPVLILRIGKSWIKPHMVTFKGTSRFYSRHSSGKYQLDVQEIGQAFAEQRSLGEQLRNWRAERITRILSDEGPVPVEGPSRVMLHFAPAGVFSGLRASVPWPISNAVRAALRPSSLSAVLWRYNADGFLVASVDESVRAYAAYVQLFRDGRLEYVDGDILNAGKRYGAGREWEIPSQSFEQKLTSTFANAMLVINQIGVSDPIYFSVALLGVMQMKLSRSGLWEMGDKHTFDRNVIQTPETQIDRSEEPPYRSSLLPIVDSIWQANGYEGTPWTKNWA